MYSSSDDNRPHELGRKRKSVEDDSDRSSTEASASSESSGSEDNPEAKSRHRKNLKSFLGDYERTIERFNYRQSVHNKQLSHLAELRSVCLAYRNSSRPVSKQLSELRKRLHNFPRWEPRSVEPCMFARVSNSLKFLNYPEGKATKD